MTESINPRLCPLCGQENACVNESLKLNGDENSSRCWCDSEDLVFPQALLEQIPNSHRRKACVCQKCLRDYMNKDLSKDNQHTFIEIRYYFACFCRRTLLMAEK